MRINGPQTPEFDAALRLARQDRNAPQPACKGRANEFVDYDVVPSEAAAEQLCETCPLYDLCRPSAIQAKPDWGVQGGIAWKHGRQYHWLLKLGHEQEFSASA